MNRLCQALVLLSVHLVWLTAGVSAQQPPSQPVGAELESPPTSPLTRVEHLLVDEEGRVYAIDQRASEVLRWSADMKFDAVIGRRGAGPGEFMNPWLMSLSGDTLWVVDLAEDRITGVHRLSGEPLGVITGSSTWRAAPGGGTEFPFASPRPGRFWWLGREKGERP